VVGWIWHQNRPFWFQPCCHRRNSTHQQSRLVIFPDYIKFQCFHLQTDHFGSSHFFQDKSTTHQHFQTDHRTTFPYYISNSKECPYVTIILKVSISRLPSITKLTVPHTKKRDISLLRHIYEATNTC
jgi:hypothetical protein